MRERDEPVRLTKIYTRGGDAGETSLGDGSRVSKLDPRIAAYGVVDEVNAQIGVVLSGRLPVKLRTPLTRIQNELFDLGADLSVPWTGPDNKLRVTPAMVYGLERDCDEINAPLPELVSFVLPGGTELAARLHVARTVARRAEIAALQADLNPLARIYLNRLSDLLFIAARAANRAASVVEPLGNRAARWLRPTGTAYLERAPAPHATSPARLEHKPQLGSCLPHPWACQWNVIESGFSLVSVACRRRQVDLDHVLDALVRAQRREVAVAGHPRRERGSVAGAGPLASQTPIWRSPSRWLLGVASALIEST